MSSAGRAARRSWRMTSEHSRCRDAAPPQPSPATARHSAACRAHQAAQRDAARQHAKVLGDVLVQVRDQGVLEVAHAALLAVCGGEGLGVRVGSGRVGSFPGGRGRG